MNNTIDNNAKRNSILKWVLIIAVNTIIAITVILMSVFYTLKQNEMRYSDKEQGFSIALDSMAMTAYQNLHTEQVFCNNWSSFINDSKYYNSMDEVLRFVRSINSEKARVMAQIIDSTTFTGMTVAKDGDTVKTVPLDYSLQQNRIKEAIDEAMACESTCSRLHITRPFTNAVDNETVIGFCHKIPIYEEGATDPHYYVLIRVLKVNDFYGKWLPPSFRKAKLALVDGEGEFIVPFNKIDGTKFDVDEANYFDFLGNRTDVGQESAKTLKQDFADTLSQTSDIYGFIGDLRCSNNKGEEGFYSYHRLQADDDWVLVGYILRDDLNVISLDTTLAIIVITGFLILVAFDGIYIMITNRRLKKSMEEIKFANEAKTRFLSSMSHDIRTPMNAIIGMTTIAAKRIDDKHQVEECLRQITRASNHLLTLINDVLDISKVESGKLSLNPTVFSLAELMENIISITQPHIKEKKMEFEIHARNVKYEYIFADELRLNQILINIISNAIKYTPEEGRVYVSLEERPSERGQNVTKLVFVVSDTGIGISEEFKKNMYDTFARDIDSRINTIQGAGLGLAIVKQMVDMMEGTIDMQSTVGKGTTFTITLDLPIAEKVTEDYILPPLRMLVVDDDELFLESAEDTLKSLGLETETVNNGADAVKLVENKHENNNDYHCVIVDWKMPDMNGVETIREIRKIVGDEVSVIIISAYDWTEIEEEAMKAGANGFITKPLFRSSVYSKLNELLNLDNHKEKKAKEISDDDLKGLHLLIAEDNDINWEIIQVMLEFHEITAVRAENGQICVDKLNAAADGEYDAILMDIQMPVMNGNQATRVIRQSDREYVKNIPIIAMTADAFAEDIAACKEAGMNGHVAKPLDMKKLIKELRSALNHEEK